MEGEFDTVDGFKPKSEAGGEAEAEEKKELEVAQNDAGKTGAAGGSAEGLDLSGKKVFNNTVRPTAMPQSGVNATDLGPTQLTIFYGGRVCVFDAIPADKVNEIMVIAASVAAASNPSDKKNVGTNSPVSSPALSRSPSLRSTASALASPQAQPYPLHRNPLCKLHAELPMARRHSLQKFFEKRRDRLVSKNPYPPQSGSKVSDNTKVDLGNHTSADAVSPQEELLT